MTEFEGRGTIPDPLQAHGLQQLKQHPWFPFAELIEYPQITLFLQSPPCAGKNLGACWGSLRFLASVEYDVAFCSALSLLNAFFVPHPCPSALPALPKPPRSGVHHQQVCFRLWDNAS